MQPSHPQNQLPDPITARHHYRAGPDHTQEVGQNQTITMGPDQVDIPTRRTAPIGVPVADDLPMWAGEFDEGDLSRDHLDRHTDDQRPAIVRPVGFGECAPFKCAGFKSPRKVRGRMNNTAKR